MKKIIAIICLTLISIPVAAQDLPQSVKERQQMPKRWGITLSKPERWIQSGTIMCRIKGGLHALRADVAAHDQHQMMLDVVGYRCAASDDILNYGDPVYLDKTDKASGQSLIIRFPQTDEWWVPTTRLFKKYRNGLL